MNTYRLTLSPELYRTRHLPYGLPRYGVVALTEDAVTQLLTDAVVRELTGTTPTGHTILDVQLQRPNHEKALNDLLGAVQQLGYVMVEATVSEWVDSTIEGVLLGGFGGATVGTASENPWTTLIIGLIGGALGGLAGKQVERVKVVYAVQRTYSGWTLVPQTQPQTQPSVRPGFASS